MGSKGVIINFIPGELNFLDKYEVAFLKENRSFCEWCDTEILVTGKRARDSVPKEGELSEGDDGSDDPNHLKEE